MSRYEAMFARLATWGEGAFIPFAMLGDPTPEASAGVLEALVAGGADALELGIPFSDPVADGPVIQAAAVRALAAGTRLADCWALIRQVRQQHADLPIGLLVYANLVAHRELSTFYEEAADAGVDSVLVADLPVDAAAEFIAAARAGGIAPVFIAPPNAEDARLARIAAAGEGYTYVVTRAGVTGVDDILQRDSSALLARLKALGAPPPVLGFGISTPGHVRQGLAMGAAGMISGSAVVRLVAEHQDDHAFTATALTSFVATMKSATEKER